MRDVLGQVLEETRLSGRVYCQTTARPPWGIQFAEAPQAVFHLVTEGSCWLFSGPTRQQLLAGDLLLVAPNTSHVLADDARTRPVALSDWLATREPGVARLGGTEGQEARLICGVFEFERGGPHHPVLRLLPKTLHLPAQQLRERADLSSTVVALAREYASGARGASLVVSRLLEVLFVQVLRAWADQQPPGGAGWIGALRDPAIAQALAVLHEDLGHAWSVTALARVACTSRATLARRFSAELGESPLAYLTRARMMQAARRLERSNDALAAIARDVGYHSEFAFNRAFHRELGMPPGEYRRRHARQAEG